MTNRLSIDNPESQTQTSRVTLHDVRRPSGEPGHQRAILDAPTRLRRSLSPKASQMSELVLARLRQKNINKSQAIRDVLEAHPANSPSKNAD
jgi:hypothetical protein